MPGINEKLLKKIMGFQIDLRRYEAGTVKKIDKILRQLEKEITRRMSKDELVSMGKRDIERVIRSFDDPVAKVYADASDELSGAMNGVVEVQVKATADAMAVVMIGQTAALPVQSVLDQLSLDPLINGGPVSAWWKKQEADTLFKFGAQIREAVLLGESNIQVARRLSGTRTTPGVLDISRKNAAALAHTSIHTVSNHARQAVFEKNDDVIKAFIWFTALDSHVCPRCMALSGKKWKNDADHTPVGHSTPFQVPSIHFNDRCVLLPETYTYKELGIDMPEPKPGMRASDLGPIPASTTFKQYLEMLPVSEQNERLGIGRAELFRSGKISLNQLIDGQGRELTLAELRRMYA